MPVCNCTVHNCEGRNVTNRQWKAHQRDDILLRRSQVQLEGSSTATVQRKEGLSISKTQSVYSGQLDPIKEAEKKTVKEVYDPQPQSTSSLSESSALPHLSINPIQNNSSPNDPESRFNYIKKQFEFKSKALNMLDLTNMALALELPQHGKDLLNYQRELEDLFTLNSPLSSYASKLSREIDDCLANLANIRRILLHPTSSLYKTSDILHSHNLTNSDPLLVTSLILPMISHLVGGVPRAQANAQLRGNILLIKLTANKLGIKDYGFFLDDHPKDVRSVHSLLSIDPKVTVYATCPQCCCIYPIKAPDPLKSNKNGKKRLSQYPIRCSHTPFPNNPDIPPCNFELLKKAHNGQEQKPLRPFVYQNPKDYLDRLLSRPEIEILMDESWTKPAETDYLTDIFQAKVCQNFVDAKGKTFKETSKAGYGNYLFAVSMDCFNPYTNKIAGPVASFGAITLVCLNIPPSIRYRAENVCLVGLIPGPNEPSREQVDQFITPLIQTFAEFWDPGVYYNRTSLYRTGKLVQMGLLPLIADMKGVRKVSGNAQCQICHLPADEVKLGPLRYNSIRSLPDEEYRRLAEEWRNAPDPAAREKCYSQNGIRWSAFLKLPYWCTGNFAIVDAMHALFLGVIPTHFRHIYGMAGKEADLIEKKSANRFKKKSKSVLPFSEINFDRGQSLLEAHSPLSRLHHATLKELCRLYLPQDQHPGPTATNKLMVDALNTWRDSVQNFERKGRTESAPAPVQVPIPEKPTQAVQLRTIKSTKPFEMVDYIEAEKTLLSSQQLSRTSFDRRRLASLKALCETYIPVDVLLLNQGTIHNKETLSGMLYEWRNKQQTAIQKRSRSMSNTTLHSIEPAREKIQKDVQDEPDVKNDIIDSETLLEIRSDIRRTIVPSWITPLSSHFGSKRGGKLKAAEWRIAATVYLPITLIRVWSGSKNNLKKFLVNTMDMVSAIVLITSYEITPRHAAEYTKYIRKYLEGLQELFPNLNFRDNHHVILHLEELVNLFGPVHTWWAFPFERIIGILEKINTNWKIGEMEKSMMSTFCSAANLRIYTGSAAGGIFDKEIQDIPDEKEDPLGRDSRTLSPEELEALSKYFGSVTDIISKVNIHKTVYYKGLRYSSNSIVARDSFITFKDGGLVIPARIENIITQEEHTTSKTHRYLSVRRYSKAENIEDPYRSFSVLKAGLYKKFPENDIEIISLEEVWCHFAQCPYNEESIIILPLDRTYPREIEMDWE